jgi:type II secretory pathway component PulM
MSTSSNAFAPAAAWWRGLAARERTGLTLAALVLLGYLIWAVAVGPALKGLGPRPVGTRPA